MYIIQKYFKLLNITKNKKKYDYKTKNIII